MKTELEKKQALEQALYSFANKNSFYAAMLTSMNISYSTQIPTAALVFTKQKEFKTLINADFFIDKLTPPQRVAVLEHEVLHFTHNHTFRFPIKGDKPPKDFLTHNVAADMAINQLIQDLPKEGIDYRNFKMNDGTAFPPSRTYEEYYELLKENKEANEKQMGGYEPIDEHGLSEVELSDEQVQEMMNEAKKVIQRTMDKTSTSWDQLPETVKEMMQSIDGSNLKLNAKRILQQCLKRSIAIQDRKHTWNRPSKRYGVYSQGTKTAEVPKIEFNFDTSGSISINEYNQFMSVIDKFMAVGAKNCLINFWHTSIYKTKKYKKGEKLSENEIEGGGTDVAPVLKNIKESNPNLAIILTDGYFDGNYQFNYSGDVLWVISKGGCSSHPYVKHGKTILLENVL